MKNIDTNKIQAQLKASLTVLIGFPEVHDLGLNILKSEAGNSILRLFGSIDMLDNLVPFTLTFDRVVWRFQLEVSDGDSIPMDTSKLQEIFGVKDLLPNIDQEESFKTIHVQRLVMEFAAGSIFPLPMTELQHLEIIANVNDLQLLPVLELYLTNIQVDYNIDFQKRKIDIQQPGSPLEVVDFSGLMQASAAIIKNDVTELTLPTFEAFLPVTEEGLFMQMVDEFYDLPSLHNLALLLGDTDLSASLPSQLPTIPSLQFTDFQLTLDQEYSGFNNLGFSLGFPEAYNWELSSGKLRLSEFKLRFDFPPPILKMGALCEIGDLQNDYVGLPMVATIRLDDQSQFEGLILELGSFDKTRDIGYSITTSHIQALGLDITKIISDAVDFEFVIDKLMLNFDANMRLQSMDLKVGYLGEVNLLPNTIFIRHPVIEVKAKFGDEVTYSGNIWADFVIGTTPAIYFPITLFFDHTEEWLLAIDHDKTEEDILLPGLTALAGLFGDATYFDNLPDSFNFEGIELSDFELRFPHPENQKINHLFFSLEMPAGMTLIPSLSVSQLKFHFDADFTQQTIQATLQLNGVVSLELDDGPLEVPLLIAKSVDEWTVELDLMPGETLILPMSKLPLLLDNAPINEALREDLVLTDVEVEALELRFPLEMDSLNFAAFKGEVSAWEILPPLQLSLVKFEVEMNIPMPFAMKTLWGSFQGQSQIDTLLLPTLQGILPYHETGLALEMVEEAYPLPGLTELKPLLGGFDLSNVLPNQFPAIDSLVLSQLLIHFDVEFTGLHYLAFRLTLPADSHQWDLFPPIANTLVLNRLVFDFTFPEPHFRLAGIVALGQSDEFPMTAAFGIEDGSFAGLTFELGSLDQSNSWSYKVGTADLSLLGFQLDEMLPGLDGLVLALTRFRLEFDPAMVLQQLYFQVHSEGTWDLIADRISITNLSLDLDIGMPAPYLTKGYIAADFDLHLDSVEKFPILLTIPEEGDWSLSLDLQDPEDAVSFAGITDLSALVGLNLETLTPPGLTLGTFNLTELVMSFPHPSQQKVSTVFIGATMPDTWQIVPHLALSDLMLYTEVDFTATEPDVTLQLTSVIALDTILIPILVARNPDQWKFGLNPEFETEFLIPFSNITQWLAALLPSLPPTISAADITLTELMFSFSAEMDKWRGFHCQGRLNNSWTPIPSVSSFKVDELDFNLDLDATPSTPLLTLEITGVILVGETRVPIKITKTTEKWIFALNLNEGESITLPFSKLETWFGENLIALPEAITGNDVRISALELVFSTDMSEWKSFSCDVSLDKSWMLTETFGLQIKRFTLAMPFPLDAGKRKIIAAIHANILAGNQTIGVIISIDTERAIWILELAPGQAIIIPALGSVDKIFNIQTLTSQMPPMAVSIGEIHLESFTITFNFSFSILSMLCTAKVDKGKVEVTLPMLEVSDDENQKNLSATMTINNLTLMQDENREIILTSGITVSVAGLPVILQNALPTTVEADVLASKDETSVTVRNTQPFALPQIRFANQRVDINGEFKDTKFTWATSGAELSTDVSFFLLHEGTHQLNEMIQVNVLNDEVHFRITVNQAAKAKLTLLEWPFRLPLIKKLKEEGWNLIDFEDAGAIKLKLPVFSHSGTEFKAEGQLHILEDGNQVTVLSEPSADAETVEESYTAKALGIPLTFIKGFFEQSGLSFIGDMLPDSIPLDLDTASIATGILGGDTSSLPDAFESYKEIQNPRAFYFYIETYPGGSIRFDFSTLEDEHGNKPPVKLLLKDPTGSIMLGAQLKRVALGETGGFPTFDFDGRVDAFFLPLLLIIKNTPGFSIPMLPDFKDVHLTLIADKVFGVITAMPIPLFFNELSLSYLGIEGLEAKTTWKNPMPGHGLNEIIKVAALLPEFARFITEPAYALPQGMDLGDAQLNFKIEDFYLKTPQYLGSVTLGHAYENEQALLELHNSEIINLLNASKKPTPANLLEVLPLTKRMGSDSVNLGPIIIGSAWAITNPNDFVSNYSGELPAESLTLLFGETQPDDSKVMILMGGHWRISGLVSADALFAMAVEGLDGFALYLAVSGEIGNQFIGFDIAGKTAVDIENSSFAIDALFDLTLLGTSVASLGVGLSEDEFSLTGHVELFDNPIIKANGTLSGTIKKSGDFSLTGDIDASGGLLSIAGPAASASATLTNTSATLNGDFTLIDIALLRIKGTVSITLNQQGQLALSGTVETNGGIFLMSEISIEGNSDLAATLSSPPNLIPFSNIKIKAKFSVLETALVKLGGSELTVEQTNTSLSFDALLSGPQAFVGFATSGENQVRISGTEIGTRHTELTIAGDFGINTPLLKLVCTIDGTLNATKNLDITGTISSSLGGFALTTGDATSVTLTENALSITAKWLGAALSLDAEIDGTVVSLAGTALFTIPVPAPWKIINPLPGGDDLDLKELFGLDISLSAGVAVHFTNDNYSAGVAVVCTFCNVDYTLPLELELDLRGIDSFDTLKNRIIDFALDNLNLDNFLNGVWWVQDLIRAVTHAFDVDQIATPVNFTLIKTNLVEMSCDLKKTGGTENSPELTAEIEIKSGFLLNEKVSATFKDGGFSVATKFDSSKVLPGLGFKLSGSPTVTIDSSGFDLSGQFSLLLLNKTIFKGDVKSSNLVGNIF